VKSLSPQYKKHTAFSDVTRLHSELNKDVIIKRHAVSG
jgi:hypothetical protein